MAVIGSSAKISINFETDNGTAVDPVNPVVTVYENTNVVLETIILTESNKITVGQYELIYKIPDGKSGLVFEIKCTIDNIDRVSRTIIQRNWV
jgi:hypothetical protein